MRGMAALLAFEVNLRVTPARARWLIAASLGFEALVRGPCLDQRAVHTEVLVRGQSLPLRQRQNAAEELARDRLVQQPIAMGRERRGIPHALIHRQAHEAAEHQVVLHRLHQLPFATHRVQNLQQQGPDQWLGRDRGAADIGVKRRKLRAHRFEDAVHDNPQLAQRVMSQDPIPGREVTEQLILPEIATAHGISNV